MEKAASNNYKLTNYGFNWLFIKRSFYLFRILYSSWISLPSILFYFLLLTAFLEQMLIYNVGMISSRYYTVLGSRDYNGFWATTINSFLSIFALVLVMSAKRYICNVLYLTWRRLLCSTIHYHYFKGIQYYLLNVVDTCIDNPDQRISQDVDKMCNAWSTIIDIIIIAPFRIIYYTYATYSVSGYTGPLAVYAYFTVGTIINKLLMTPVVRTVFKQEKLEGNFRFKHMHIRSNAEAMAFLDGGLAEAEDTNKKLGALIQVQMNLFNRMFPLTISINLFDYIGSILSFLIIAVPIFGGKYDSLNSVQLSSLISQTSFVCMYLINSFSQLVDQANKVVDIAGCTHRVSQLIEELLKSKSILPNNTAENYEMDASFMNVENILCVVENLTFTPPNRQEILVEGLHMRVVKNENILITGDSGSGKSSFLRVLCGLWPKHKGSIRHFYRRLPLDVLFVPQKPYFSSGSLYRQICFPLTNGEEDGDTHGGEIIMQYLKLANLEKVVERTGGLFVDPEWNWNDVLSSGELQRLSFVRLFYHRPPIAYLDEACSALNLSMESTMYQQCVDLGITLVSVGHRDSLRRFHRLNIHLSGSKEDGKWSLNQIR